MSIRLIIFLESNLGWLGCFLLSTFNRILRLFKKQTTEVAPRKLLFIKFIEQGALILHRQCFAEAVFKYGKENVYLTVFEESVPTALLLHLFEPENIIAVKHSSFIRLAKSGWSALARCRQAGIDTTIDLEFFSAAPAIFSYLTGSRNRAGYASLIAPYRTGLLTHRVSYSPYVHVSETGRVLLQALSLQANQLPSMPALDTAASATPFNGAILEQRINDLYALVPENIFARHEVILINPNFKDQLPLRQWKPDNYVELVNLLALKMPDCFFVFTGRPDEYDITNTYLEKIETKNTLNICGKTDLYSLLNLYSKSRLLITTDSGPAHFASLTNLPGIVIFGPETPLLYGPLSKNIQVIFKNLPCSPCFNAYNNRISSCTNNLCVSLVQPGEVAALAQQMLSKV